jgi:hypothetical protein
MKMLLKRNLKMKRLYLLIACIVLFNMTVLAQYTGGNGDGYSSASSSAGWMTSLRLSLKVFLQGPYNTGTSQMNTTLQSSGVLAAHFGSTPIPFGAVDSVNIEMRDSASAAQSTLRVYAPAWLMADGTLRGFGDTAKAYVELDAPIGSYYIVVRHRNHLAIMSAGKIVYTTDSTGYDFTTAQAQAYGTNPMAALTGGVYALFSGDANQSGFITATDINDVINHLNANSYLASDVNLSAFSTASDINIMINNLNKNTQVPN